MQAQVGVEGGPVEQRGLWWSDGSPAGTRLLAPVFQGGRYSRPALLNGRLIFWATDGVYSQGLWASDGTQAGTARLSGVEAYGLASEDTWAAWQGQIAFVGSDRGYGSDQLWLSDGETA